MTEASRDRRLILLLALGIVAAMAAVWGQNPLTVRWDDIQVWPDDAVRIVQARDLAAGQGWFDPAQRRLGVDAPVPVHWSRLIDGPLAGLTLALAPLIGGAQAERAVASAWPLLVGFLVLLPALGICRQLAGRRGLWCGGLLFLPLLLTDFEFRPGRVDHHNVQLAFLVLVLWAVIEARREPRWAALAGAATAAALAVGLETVPILAAAAAAVALAWAVEGPGPAARAAAGYGLGLAAGVVLAMGALLPRAVLTAPLCDQLSLAPGSLSLLAGLGLAGAVRTAGASPGRRLAALVILGAALGAVLLLAFPHCLRGPFEQLDPEVFAENENVLERQNVLAAIAGKPAYAIYKYVVWPLAGLAGLGFALLMAPRGRRFAPAVLLAAAAVSAAILAAEIRGHRFALPLTLFGGVWLLARISAWGGALRVAKPVALLALVVAVTPAGYLFKPGWPIEAPAEAATGPDGAPAGDPYNACISDAEMAALAALPLGRTLSPVDFGPFILLKTPHHAVPATLHRNPEGWRAGYRIGRVGEGEARALLTRVRADYLVLCPEWRKEYRKPGSLAAALAAGRVPGWLTPVPGTRHLAIYRVGGEGPES